jgi:hypothetical protein
MESEERAVEEEQSCECRWNLDIIMMIRHLFLGWKGSGRVRAGNCAVDLFPPDEIKEEETGDSIGTGAAGRTPFSAGCRIHRARYSVCVAGKRRSAARRRIPPGRERRL